MAERVLRVAHRTVGDREQVTLRYECPDDAPFDATIDGFSFSIDAADRDRIRWYLEEYPLYPEDPGPKLAGATEEVLKDAGDRLFTDVFHANRNAQKLWDRLEPDLDGARVEVSTEGITGWPVPWELLRDPDTGAWLAVRAAEFVRTHPQGVRPARPPQDTELPIRILLAICRPGREQDVRFRSVARNLVTALGGRPDAFQLDVLRPATFEALTQRLRQAKTDDQPYHVVHFDGHGGFLNLAQATGADAGDEQPEFNGHSLVVQAVYPHGARSGRRGYLLFENPEHESNLRLVDGPEFGKLLADTGVPVLVMNACRSAKAGEPAEDAPTAQDQDSHQRVQAYGSFAQEVMDAGIPGVLAMQYNLWVATAAQLVGNLYADLARGLTFGQAASACRKQLEADPLRDIANQQIAVQDWSVPVAYEAAPIQLLPPQEDDGLQVTVDADGATPGRGAEIGLPEAPEFGFIGRDETLLALDRAFDEHRIVLLHGYAGCGKTQTAAEFARWYGLTGGVEGPVFFTSFQQHTTLREVLGLVEQAFGGALAASGTHWFTLEPHKQREVALQVLSQVPILWIWDNVEPITGFPAGTDSEWSQEEQDELRAFLVDLRDRTQAKVLLTSRRGEQAWLGDLPRRISVPPMPMIDREALARAIGRQYGRDHLDMSAWRPLLRYTQGNPLTTRVVVGQAIRDGLETREQIEAFVEKLRSGEAEIDDDEELGRDASLTASLSYGFGHAFAEDERKILALLHLFQGFVAVHTLRLMGLEAAEWSLAEVRALTDEAASALLDRAAEIGLVTPVVEGFYTIHPALPLHFRDLFQEHYADRRPEATRAFVEAMGELGHHYNDEYERGNRDVIAVLAQEEANLLHARRLAIATGWWPRVVSAMVGLRVVYFQRGRRADWARLVEDIVPKFCDPTTDGPLPEREDLWHCVTQYRVLLARESRDFPEAERLQWLCVDWSRQQAQALLALPAEELGDRERHTIRTLSTALQWLADILQEQGKPECIRFLQEDAQLSRRIGDRPGEATSHFILGHAFVNIQAVRDLDKAEQSYRQSLELRPERDRLGRGRSRGQLGRVAIQRAGEASSEGETQGEMVRHLNTAAQEYHRALELLPDDALHELGVVHNQLGVIYEAAEGVDRAVEHYQESVRYRMRMGDAHGAAGTQFNMATMFAQANRFTDALQYARAALRGYGEFGDRAQEDIDKAQRLIAEIEKAMAQQ